MGRYSEYCESGAGWLGELPSHWQLRRISALYDARNEKVSDQDYPPLSVTMQGIVPQLETAAKTQDGDNRKLVRTGDFVINSRSDRRGACGISEYDGSVTLISNVLAPKDRNAMSARYYSYLFRSEGFADEFYRQGTGIVDDLWSTNWSRMKNILVARPPLAEQERIADYLDAKTAEIDALVTDCEREVALLQEYRKAVIFEAVTKGLDPGMPMKDSGVEWIGEIPEGWETRRVKQVTELRTGKTPTTSRPDFFDGDVPWFTPGDLLSFEVEEPGRYVSDLAVESGAVDMVPAGSVLFVGVGYSSGKSAFVTIDCCTNQQITALIPCGVGGRHLAYLMSVLGDEILKLATFNRVPLVNNEFIGNLRIPAPESDEQNAIVAELDAKTAEIDALIKDKQTMADKLREYRKSLISEAVTGKFKVPGI